MRRVRKTMASIPVQNIDLDNDDGLGENGVEHDGLARDNEEGSQAGSRAIKGDLRSLVEGSQDQKPEYDFEL